MEELVNTLVPNSLNAHISALYFTTHPVLSAIR